MNLLVLLASLFLLVSCVEGGLSHPQLNSSRFVEQYRENLVINLGTVESITRQGKDIGFDSRTGQTSLKEITVDQEINSAIIKIEGTNIYKYQEISDKISGKTRRRIILQKQDPANEIAEILDSQTGYIEGSYLFLKGSNNSRSKELIYDYVEKVNFIGRIDLDSPHCSYVTESTKTGTLKRFNNPASTLTTVNLEQSICGEPLTPAQIKAIDLKSIEFCNETAAIVSCKSGQNLSPLTNDL